jgi:hypothetical protein
MEMQGVGRTQPLDDLRNKTIIGAKGK